MRKTAVTIGLLVLLAGSAIAAYTNDTLMGNINGYRFVSSTNTAMGTTGLTTNTAYVCIPLTNIVYLSSGTADTNSSYRGFVFAATKYFYANYAVMAASNLPTTQSINETVRAGSVGHIIYNHAIMTDTTIGSATVASE